MPNYYFLNSIWRVVNAPNKLALRSYADQSARVEAWLPNGTLLRVKGVQREYYRVAVVSGEAQGKFGYVWKEANPLDGGAMYVERVPEPGPLFPVPVPEIPQSFFETALWWALVSAIFIVLAAVAVAYGGPVK